MPSLQKKDSKTNMYKHRLWRHCVMCQTSVSVHVTRETSSLAPHALLSLSSTLHGLIIESPIHYWPITVWNNRGGFCYWRGYLNGIEHKWNLWRDCLSGCLKYTFNWALKVDGSLTLNRKQIAVAVKKYI